MPATRKKKIRVEVELANGDDSADLRCGFLPADNVRRLKVVVLVDPSISGVMLPTGLAKKLGIPVKGKIKVERKDGSYAIRDRIDGLRLKLGGRGGLYRAYLDPKRRLPVIGRIVLNDLDLVVDLEKGELYPRDPRYVIVET